MKRNALHHRMDRHLNSSTRNRCQSKPAVCLSTHSTACAIPAERCAIQSKRRNLPNAICEAKNITRANSSRRPSVRSFRVPAINAFATQVSRTIPHQRSTRIAENSSAPSNCSTQRNWKEVVCPFTRQRTLTIQNPHAVVLLISCVVSQQIDCYWTSIACLFTFLAESNHRETYRPGPGTNPMSCVFDDKVIGMGEAFETGQRCRTCTCITPPALTCIQTDAC